MTRPDSAALRKGRYSQPGQAYHLTLVCADRAPMFADFHAARLIIQVMRELETTGGCESLAFVVMPDHVHWLLILKHERLSDLVRYFKSRAATELNRHQGVQGRRLWQAGFHDHAVRRDEDLAGIARYIVANPLRAGLVPSLRLYPHWDAIWIT